MKILNVKKTKVTLHKILGTHDWMDMGGHFVCSICGVEAGRKDVKIKRNRNTAEVLNVEVLSGEFSRFLNSVSDTEMNLKHFVSGLK